MFTKKSKTKLLFSMYANLAVGLLLAITGIFLELTNSTIVENVKAFVGLSFIPLMFGLYSLMTLVFIKKYPEKMKPVIISENEERVVAAKNEADAITFQVLKWVLMLVFFGYTFMVPGDIFEAPSWWVIFALYFIAVMLQGIILSIFQRKGKDCISDD